MNGHHASPNHHHSHQFQLHQQHIEDAANMRSSEASKHYQQICHALQQHNSSSSATSSSTSTLPRSSSSISTHAEPTHEFTVASLQQWIEDERNAGNSLFINDNSIEIICTQLVEQLRTSPQSNSTSPSTSSQSLTEIEFQSFVFALTNNERHQVFSTILKRLSTQSNGDVDVNNEDVPVSQSSSSSLSLQVNSSGEVKVGLNHYNNTAQQQQRHPSSSSSPSSLLQILKQRHNEIQRVQCVLSNEQCLKLWSDHASRTAKVESARSERDRRANELLALDSTRLMLLNEMNEGEGVLQNRKHRLSETRERVKEMTVRVKQMDEKLNELPEKLKSVESKIEGHGYSLSSLQNRLPLLEASHIELQGGSKAVLERQHLKLTTVIANEEKELRRMREAISQLQKEIEAIELSSVSASRLSASLVSALPSPKTTLQIIGS